MRGRVPNYHYLTPTFRTVSEPLFPEAHLHSDESLCVRTGAKRRFAPRYTWQATQYVAGLDRYAELAYRLRQGSSERLPPHQVPAIPRTASQEPIQLRKRHCEGSYDPEGTGLAGLTRRHLLEAHLSIAVRE